MWKHLEKLIYWFRLSDLMDSYGDEQIRAYEKNSTLYIVIVNKILWTSLNLIKVLVDV